VLPETRCKLDFGTSTVRDDIAGRRGFASAAFLVLQAQYSCDGSYPFCPDLIERSPVGVEGCQFASVFLIPSDDAIGVLRIDLHESGRAATAFTSNQRAARTSEQVCYDIAGRLIEGHPQNYSGTALLSIDRSARTAAERKSVRTIVKQHPHKIPHTPASNGAFRLQMFEKFGSQVP
jgi:hypothetical protein